MAYAATIVTDKIELPPRQKELVEGIIFGVVNTATGLSTDVALQPVAVLVTITE